MLGRRAWLGFGLVVATVLGSSAASAREPLPWEDDDGLDPNKRLPLAGDVGIRAGAEYRANWLYINPINLNSTEYRRASWLEHRLRIDTRVDMREKVELNFSADLLDGTLWGDNGTFGGDPTTESGIQVGASNPNNTRYRVGFRGGDDELDPNNYGYVLQQGDAVHIRRLYGDVKLPVGVLRIGRQPTAEGTSIMVADGDGRTNRWGFANRGDSTDRILFATKPLEGLKKKEDRDKSPDRGLIWALFHDHVTQGNPERFGDDLNGVGTAFIYRRPLPVKRQHYELLWAYSHRWEPKFDTNINITTLRASAKIRKLTVGAEGVYINGRTREVSEALALINNDPIVRQKIHQGAARGVVRWDEPTWTAYFEVDFATSDPDPNPGTTLSNLTWAEDNNVGLLMFERVLAFHSARTAAAGVELLRRIGAETFPAERIDTEGSFTSALAFFPQFDFYPIENVLFRGGVLAAWVPGGLVDPLETLKQRDGNDIEDDLVNFNGGKPGEFLGVEVDGRIQWRYEDAFIFDLEGAVLFPGDAFEDENQQASRSVMVQGRTTFVF